MVLASQVGESAALRLHATELLLLLGTAIVLVVAERPALPQVERSATTADLSLQRPNSGQCLTLLELNVASGSRPRRR